MNEPSDAPPILDVHTHIVNPDLSVCLTEAGDRMEVQDDGERLALVRDGRVIRHMPREMVDAEARIAAMDRLGVDMQVLLPLPPTLVPVEAAAPAAAVAQGYNEFVANVVARAPGRFVAFGQVPIQDKGLAAEALAGIANHASFAGIELAVGPNVRPLSHESLDSVFDRVEHHGLSVFVHPVVAPPPTAAGRSPVEDFAISMPSATTSAVFDVVWGGRLRKNPGLRFCFAHGGGALCALSGRIRAGLETLPREGEGQSAPSDALVSGNSPIWIDGLVYDAGILHELRRQVGAHRVVLGSDYPMAAADASFLDCARMAALDTPQPGLSTYGEAAQDFLAMPRSARRSRP